MGWTTAIDPAVPPLFAKQAVMELNEIPIIDKAFYIDLGNNLLVMEYVKENMIDKLSAYVAWLLRNTKAFAVKLANPGGGEAWYWRYQIQSLEDIIPIFNITPTDLINAIVKANESLALPHSVHIHCNNTLRPGNVSTTIDSIKMAENFEVNSAIREQALHIAHIQYNSYGGENWESIESKAEEVAKTINSIGKVTVDLGQVTFGNTILVLLDNSVMNQLSGLTFKNSSLSYDFEVEGSFGALSITRSKDNFVSSLQWAIGLELALLIDPWKLSLTTDSPSGGLFTRYPEIICWLMSKKERDAILSEMPSLLQKRSIIATIDREYDLYDVAIISRASPAKALGLSEFKGHLGIGADADIAIYNINPQNINQDHLVKAFSNAAYTIKCGKIVVKDGCIVQETNGQIMWTNAKACDEHEREIIEDLELLFNRFYSLRLDAYEVHENHIHNGRQITPQSTKDK
jgi:formylmethanofuran dehydrogenase subunit A